MTLSRIGELSAEVTDTSGTISLVTGSFTPPNNSLLVAVCGVVNGDGGADVRTGMTLAGGGHSWTLRAGPNGGTVASPYYSAQEIWTAPVTTGASMTLTYSHAGNVGGDRALTLIHVLSYTDSGGGIPTVGATATGTHDQGDAGVTITLSSAPASLSEVVASRWYSSNGNDVSATPATGWTEIYDAQSGVGGYGSLQTQIRTGSTSDSVGWDDVATGAETAWNSAAAAVEVVVPAASSGINVLRRRIDGA